MTDWLFDDESPTVPAELVDCRLCLDQYLALKEAMSLFDQVSPALEPAEEFWPGYEARLRVKLADEARPSRWQRWFHRPLWLIPVAAALMVLFFSIAWSQRLSHSVPDAPVTETADAKMGPKPGQGPEKEDVPKPPKTNKRKPDKSAKPERKDPSHLPYKKPNLLYDTNPMMALAALTAEDPATVQHIERAQRLLRSFRNSSPVNDANFDLAYEKKQARQLMSNNILLRREAETRGDWPTEEILSSLESLLLDIGNLPKRPTAEDVTPIKERMEKKEIVARLQLYATPMTVAVAE